MKKSYPYRLKEYDEPVEFDAKKILMEMKRYKDPRKKSTSVALDETTIKQLYEVTEAHGIHG